MLKQKIRVLIFIKLILFASALAKAQSQPAKSKELVIALNAEFETLNPVVNSMMAAVYILDATQRPLVVLDVAGQPKALLIKEIPSFENKLVHYVEGGDKTKKGLQVQFDILPQAVWGDGEPVTCQDVQASWEFGRHPQVSTPNRADYDNIASITYEEKNKKKCTVVFKEAKWNFYLNLPRPLPAHLEQKIFQENKDRAQGYERNSLYVKNPTHPGLYDGPYRVAELQLGSHIVLVRNEKYFATRPYFDKVIFKFILNSSTMESQLRSGGVQMTSSSGLSFDQAVAFEKKVKKENLPYEVLFVPGVVYSHLDLNLSHPALQELEVRKALSYAINREEIVRAFFEGRQKAAFHFSTELDSWYTQDPKEIVVYDYNKSKALQLLEQAGWKLGSDGIRSKNGQRLSFTVVGAADNKLGEMVQVYLQSAFKQIGAELKVKNFPARVLFSEILRKRNFEMGLYSWVSAPNGSQYSTLHSSMIPTEANSFSGSNRPGWKNKKVDVWLEEFEREFKATKRNLIMKKVLRAYTEDLPALPLYYKANTSVIPKGLKNYHMSGHMFSEYLEIENWSF